MSAANEGRKPVVPMPRWSNIIGCARAVVAILVLAFTAAATGLWRGIPAFGIALFTSSATILIFAYYFVSLSHKPGLYNRWVVLGLEAAGTLLWLVSLALLARWTSMFRGIASGSGYGFWHAPFSPAAVGLQPHPGMSHARKTGIAFAGVAAGLSGLEFALFLITLVTFSMSLSQQRSAENPIITTHATPPMAPVAGSTKIEKPAASATQRAEPFVV